MLSTHFTRGQIETPWNGRLIACESPHIVRPTKHSILRSINEPGYHNPASNTNCRRLYGLAVHRGLIFLIGGAELLVRGASRLALSLGITPLVVGLTIVAFGISAPEVVVAMGAVLDGRTNIAIGNVVGSNIVNVLFILGVSALVTPLLVNAQIIRQEVPIMMGASMLLLMALDASLSRIEPSMLLVPLLACTVFLVVQSRRENKASADGYECSQRKGDSHWLVQLLLIVVGLALLALGSRWLVSASVSFAKTLGVSDLVIGLTIVAAGTSMPEVATSVMAAIRKEEPSPLAT